MYKKWLFLFLVLLGSIAYWIGYSNEKNNHEYVGDKSGTPAPYEITMAYMGSTQRDLQEVQDAINRVTLEKINSTVKLVPIDAANYYRQINLMLIGNAKLDLFLSSTIGTHVLKGQIISLDTLLDKYGENIRQTLGADVWNSVRMNGHVYGLPSNRDMAWTYGVMMRKDVLERNKIDPGSIHKLSDLGPVFDMVKKNEHNMYPLVTRSSNESLYDGISGGTFDGLGDLIGILPNYDNDLKVVDLYASPSYLAGLNLLRSWYLAGYMPKDTATNLEPGTEMVRAERAFAYFTPMKPGIETQESLLAGTPMVAVPLSSAVTTTDNMKILMTCIAQKSERPEKAMLFLNLLYSDKRLINLLDNGIEGKHYVRLTDNQIDFPPGVNASNTGYTLQNWMIGNQFNSYVWAPGENDLWENMQTFNREAKKSKALGFTFNMEQVKAEIAMVNEIREEYRMGLETGTFDPKVKLPEFNAKLKAAGIDRIIAEKQRQVDEWSTNK